MRRISIVCLAAWVGCSFVDDFDKFQLAEQPGTDAGTPVLDAGPSSDVAASPRRADASMDTESAPGADAAVIDAAATSPDAAEPVDAGSDAGAGVCGDGVIDSARGETCDDRNQTPGDGCEPVTCTASPTTCGDEGLTKLRCYPDADRDGYPNLDGASTMACACPPQRVAVDDPQDRSKHDCYDDAEAGAKVHPGQLESYEHGYGRNGEVSFDYDCDGDEQPTLPTLPEGGCAGLLLLCSGAERGFEGKTPACGATGVFSTCSSIALMNCTASTGTRVMTCN